MHTYLRKTKDTLSNYCRTLEKKIMLVLSCWRSASEHTSTQDKHPPEGSEQHSVCIHSVNTLFLDEISFCTDDPEHMSVAPFHKKYT